MKHVSALLTCVFLFAATCACHAQTFDLKVTSTQLVVGEPDTLYEVNPGQNATVTCTSRSSYYCFNNTSMTKTAYLTWSPQLRLTELPVSSGNVILLAINVRHKQPIIGPNMAWTLPNDSFSASAPTPVGIYQAKSATSITEDKTGDESTTVQDTRTVTVRPYA